MELKATGLSKTGGRRERERAWRELAGKEADGGHLTRARPVGALPWGSCLRDGADGSLASHPLGEARLQEEKTSHPEP